MPEFNVKTIGIVGAGTMGSGIALTALQSGFQVVLYDPFPESLHRAVTYLEKFLAKKGMAERMSFVQTTGDLADMAACQVVIEAALEDITLKHELFRALDAHCSRDAILATNTSTLSVTAIAAVTNTPQRVAGMHFFNPAPVLPLVEVVRGAHTVEPVVRALVKLAEDFGKTPVVAEDTPGFIVNRVARPFYGEALRLAGEKISPIADIDLVLRQGAGFRMGPFELMDLIGVDVNATAMRSMFEQTFGEDRYRPHPLQIRQMDSGDLGRKTGRGFYNYRSSSTGIRADEPPAPRGGQGVILFYNGKWNLGLEHLLTVSGYQPQAYPEAIEKVRAVFITQSASPDLTYEIEKLDYLLPPDIPVFIQCLDATLEQHLPITAFSPRFVGLDSAFLSTGNVGTLVACENLKDNVRHAAETIIRSTGRIPVWVSDSPALVTPRVVCMLINEAAFALQEGVADSETIDLAMRLGVSYPKGLLAWGREIGWGNVLAVIDHLHREYGEDRYRACRLLRVWARKETRRAGGLRG